MAAAAAASVATITSAPASAAAWDEGQLLGLKAEYPGIADTEGDALSKYNPTPGGWVG